MGTVTSLTSKNLSNTLTNIKNWNSLVYNVKEHGLIGDGVTDDTVKLQALVDLAISEGRKTIAFDSGTYKVTALTNANQVFFVGDNASFTGGYAGTIEQLGEIGVTDAELDALKAETVTGIGNVKTTGGAAGDGTTDDSAAYTTTESAVSVGDKIVFPTATYRANIDITKSIHIDFMGSALKAIDTTSKIIEASGTLAATGFILSTAASRGDRTLTMTATVTGIAAGDMILLRDDTVRVTDSSPDVNLEVHEVLSVSGTDIVIKDFVRLPKAVSATANIYKINPIENIIIENLVLEAIDGATGNHGLYFQYCKNVIFKNLTMTNSVGECVTFRSSMNCMLDGFDFNSPQATGSGQGYGVGINRGSSIITIKNGVGDGMRHVIDANNCFDVLVDNITAKNNASTPFGISHNGWDSDITYTNCRVQGTNSYGFNASGQGVTDPYSLAIYNIRLENIDIQMDDIVSNLGIGLQVPVKESLIKNVNIVCGTGRSAAVDNTAGIRFLPVDNDCLVENVTVKGTRYGGSLYNPTSKVQSNDTDRVRFKDINIKNCSYGFQFTFAYAIHLENIKCDNIQTNVIVTDYTSAGEKCRHLVMKDISVSNHIAGTFIVWDADIYNSNGIIGEISNIRANTTTKGNLTVIAGQALTLENILLDKNGEVIRMAAASAITMNANPFPLGMIEGQKMTLLSLGNAITIPDGTNNLNDGSVGITLDSSNWGVQYVYSNGNWVQI